jgi:tRNA A37 methylthiotransferase MiaB
MNRPYNRKEILKNFKLFQTNLPNLKWGTDIIVGFPNETETDFQQTKILCRKIGFTQIHTFRFSPRPNTPAKFLYTKSTKIPSNVLKQNSQKIRQLSV